MMQCSVGITQFRHLTVQKKDDLLQPCHHVYRCTGHALPFLFTSIVCCGFAAGFNRVCVPLLLQAAPGSELFRESAWYLNPRFEQRMRGQPKGLPALVVRNLRLLSHS